MMVGKQQDAGAEQDAFGGGRDEAQAFQRIGDRQAGRERDRAYLRAGVQHDVFWQVEGLEAAVLGVPGDGGQVVRVNPVVRRVVDDPELHSVLLPPGDIAVTTSWL